MTGTVGGKAPVGLGRDALLDFSMEVTLEGEALTPDEITELLAKTDGLALVRGQWIELDRKHLESMIDRFREVERTAKKNGIAFGEAMRLGGVAGKVRISKMVPGIGEEALTILEPGEYFGEMALIDEAPRSADAITNTTCTLGAISKAAFDNLLFMHKDLAYDLLWTFVRNMSSRLRETNEKMRAFLVMAGKF